MFGWFNGELIVPTLVQVVPSIVFWTTDAVSVIELSSQVSVRCRLLPFPATVYVRLPDLIGGRASDTGRIMSISSWLRMWQW